MSSQHKHSNDPFCLPAVFRLLVLLVSSSFFVKLEGLPTKWFEPAASSSAWYVAFFNFFLVIHFQKLHCQNLCTCSPTCIDYKIEIFSVGLVGRVPSFLTSRCKASMAGRMESNGTGIGEFPSLVGTTFFFFAGTFKSGSARLLGLLTYALPVRFLFCPVWRSLPAGENGVMKHASISCRNNF